MRSIEIEDTKSFMSALFVKDSFDSFLVKSADITTFVLFSIDGSAYRDFFGDELEITEEYVSWSILKPYCYNIIKGKKVPLSMKFVFSLPSNKIDELIDSTGLGIKKTDINALSINVRFENNKVSVITGTSLRTFTLDKSFENAWDEYVSKFLLAL